MVCTHTISDTGDDKLLEAPAEETHRREEKREERAERLAEPLGIGAHNAKCTRHYFLGNLRTNPNPIAGSSMLQHDML